MKQMRRGLHPAFGRSRGTPAFGLVILLVIALTAGCASRPSPNKDGPGANPPADLARVPDAVPRIEPLRSGGPNKPYAVFGRYYVPMTDDAPLSESGLASWYGRKFQGKTTSSGEPYDMYAMTAAHKTMPIPSYARVRNPANGREIIVRINDRGPFVDGRVIDLSYTAALRLDLLRGVAPVEVERLTQAQIRAGLEARNVAAAAVSPATPPSLTAAPPTVAIEAVNPSAAVAVMAVAPPAPAVVMPLDDPAPGEAPALTGWWLQLGAFQMREGALRLQQRTLQQAGELPAVAVFEADGVYRVQVGPYGSRDLAVTQAGRLRQQIGIEPLLVERTPGM